MKPLKFSYVIVFLSFLFFGCKKNSQPANYWTVNGTTYTVKNIYWISQFGFIASDAHFNNIIINFCSDTISSGKYNVVNHSITPDQLTPALCSINGYLMNKPSYGSVGENSDYINFTTPATHEGFTVTFNNITVTDSTNKTYTISGNLKM